MLEIFFVIDFFAYVFKKLIFYCRFGMWTKLKTGRVPSLSFCRYGTMCVCASGYIASLRSKMSGKSRGKSLKLCQVVIMFPNLFLRQH